jgi:multiple sugar transport system substrate-binding protein
MGWKRLLAAILTVTMIMSLAISGGVAFAEAAGKTTVTFWNGFTGGDREYLEKLVNDFNAQSTTTYIEMNIMPWDVLGQKMASSYAANQGPDLCGAGKDGLEQYAELDALYDISDYFDQFDINLLQPALVDNITMAGKPRGVPLNFGTIMLFYNKDMFAEAALSLPTTWDELADCAVKLTKVNGDTVEQYGLAIGTKQTIENWGIFIWGNGGDILDADGKAVCNSPEAVAAIDYWANLIKDKKISPPVLTGVECDQLFQNQKAAMYICGPWVTTPLENAGVNFGVVDMPAGPAAQITVANGSVIAMAKTAEAKKANIYEFYDYWLSKESQGFWSKSVGFAPVRNDMLDDPTFADSKWVVPFTQTAQFARFYLPGGAKFPQVNDALINAYEQVLLAQATAQEALDGAAQEIDSIMMG